MSFNYRRLIDNYIYFYHVDKFCVIPTYPESISDTLQSTFTSTNALSRSAPVFSYQNSGPRNVSVNLQLHRDLMRDVNVGVSNLKDNVVDFSGDDYIDTLINYLQAVAMPKYYVYQAGSKSVVPPMIAIRFGNTVFIKGIVNGSVSVKYSGPILDTGKYAIIDVDFSVSEVDPYDVTQVIAEGSFRGITQTFRDGIYRSTSAAPIAVSTDRVTPVVSKAKNTDNSHITEKLRNNTPTEKVVKFSAKPIQGVQYSGKSGGASIVSGGGAHNEIYPLTHRIK